MIEPLRSIVGSVIVHWRERLQLPQHNVLSTNGRTGFNLKHIIDMELTTQLIAKIRQIVRYFETSKIIGADYGAIATFHDGPGHILQLTYGSAQTTEYGNLKTLIQMYIDAGGKYAKDFSSYMPWMGDRNRASLATSSSFLNLLKQASTDIIMQSTQDRFFNIYYFNPARQWCERNGLTLPLSMLVIYDSFVHSGSIMTFLRDKFAEMVPSQGGDEKRWITAYVNARDSWLENNTSVLLQHTDYRTDSFLYAIQQNNWMLDQPFIVLDYKTKDETDTPKIQVSIA
jgi:chitosanase